MEGISLATQIFEEALMLHGDDLEFVLHYLGFLISVNDDEGVQNFYRHSCRLGLPTEPLSSGATSLIERVGQKFSADKARPLWAHWAKYRYQYGDLAAIHALDQRIAEIYPNGT